MDLDRAALDRWITREDDAPDLGEVPFVTARCWTHERLENIHGAAEVAPRTALSDGMTYGALYRVTLECGGSTNVIGTPRSVGIVR